MKKALFIIPIVLSLMMCSTALAGGKCIGKTVLVPATYNVITEGIEVTASRLIIRNVDPHNSITLSLVNFHNSTEVYEYLTEDQVMAPLESLTFPANSLVSGFPSREPREGGRPYFIVKWRASQRVLPPRIGAAVLTYSVLSEASEIWVNRAMDSIPGTVIDTGCQ